MVFIFSLLILFLSVFLFLIKIVMNLEDFNYDLSPNMIAQKRIKPYHNSNLMVVGDNSFKHKKFYQIIDYLDCGDLLVFNNSKVIPARFYVHKNTGGNVEVLLLNKLNQNTALCLLGGKKLKENTSLEMDSDEFRVSIDKKIGGGKFILKFWPDVDSLVNKFGEMPTPPYIKKNIDSFDDYQTVYADKKGSVAAPTAGFHFTDELINKLKSKGIKIAYITLHVNMATFSPVRVEDITQHKMEPEYYEIDKKTADLINETLSSQKKLVVVGTTTLKCLESSYSNKIISKSGFSDLFIYPGYKFKLDVDMLVTNFHLPKSTLLMLVSAFLDKETILRAYREAINNNYRFYSFGDAMLLCR